MLPLKSKSAGWIYEESAGIKVVPRNSFRPFGKKAFYFENSHYENGGLYMSDNNTLAKLMIRNR